MERKGDGGLQGAFESLANQTVLCRVAEVPQDVRGHRFIEQMKNIGGVGVQLCASVPSGNRKPSYCHYNVMMSAFDAPTRFQVAALCRQCGVTLYTSDMSEILVQPEQMNR